MIATLRTSRLLPALLAATLLLGAEFPLVQYACAMSGAEVVASSLASPLGPRTPTTLPDLDGQGGDRSGAAPCEHGPACEHLPASARGALCHGEAAAGEAAASDDADAAVQFAADCAGLSSKDCYEAEAVHTDEAHDLNLRTTALILLPLSGHLWLPRAGATTGRASSLEDASPPDIPAQLRFAVLLL